MVKNLNGGVPTVVNQLDLMKKDAEVEAREIEGRRRGSTEAAHARGLAEGYGMALKLLKEHCGVTPSKNPQFTVEEYAG